MSKIDKAMDNFTDQMLNKETAPKKSQGFFALLTAGEVTTGLINNVILSYQNYILTQFVQLSTALTANILAIMNFINLIFTPLGGAFYDRVKFKKGKYWPWFFIIPLIISGINVWMTGNVAYGGNKVLTAVLMIAGVACGNIFLWSLIRGIVPTLSRDTQEQTVAATWTNIWKEVAKYAGMSLAPSLMIIWSVNGTEWDPRGLFITTLVFSIIGCLLGAVIGVVYKKKVEDAGMLQKEADRANTAKTRTSIIDLFKQVFTNKFLLLIFVVIVFSNSRSYTTQNLHTYYYKFIWENPAAMSTMRLYGQIAVVIATFLVPVLKKYVFKETKAFYVFTMAGVCICQFLTLFAKTYAAYEIIEVLEYFIFGFKGVMDVLLFTIAIDVIRYETYKLGETPTLARGAVMGLFSSALAAAKIMCGYVVNGILAYCGYAAGTITEGFKSLFPVLYAVVPGCLTLISVLLMLFFYKTKDADLVSMRDELNAAGMA